MFCPMAFFCFCIIIYSTSCSRFFFFFNDTATTEIYTLSLHDALPIFRRGNFSQAVRMTFFGLAQRGGRSEEHTSELQSQFHLVCRLLLEKKKQKVIIIYKKKKKKKK